jgi:hypothetical protein
MSGDIQVVVHDLVWLDLATRGNLKGSVAGLATFSSGVSSVSELDPGDHK